MQNLKEILRELDENFSEQDLDARTFSIKNVGKI